MDSVTEVLRPQRYESPYNVNNKSSGDIFSRQDIQEVFDDRCELRRPITTEDETGGSSTIEMSHGIVRCTIQYLRPNATSEVEEAGGGLQSMFPYMVFFPPATDVIPQDRIYSPYFLLEWQASTNYLTGTILIPKTRNHHYYKAKNSGVSAVSEPSWPIQSDQQIGDNNIIWQEAGRHSILEIVSIDLDVSDPDQIVAYAKGIDN